MASARNVWELSRAVLNDRDGYVIVLRIFMDESGTHDGSDVVAVAAYIGKPKEWQRFTKAWNIAKRPIKVFHSVDCQNLAEEFDGWNPKDRDSLVARLLPTLATHNLIGLAVAINMRDLDVALRGKPHLGELFGSAYGLCFHCVVQSVIETVEKNSNNQSLSFVHETNDFQVEALEAFSEIKKSRKRHSGGMAIAFADKDKFVPLQAADVLAYEANKKCRNPSKPVNRRSLEALGKGTISIRAFTAENMPWLVSRLEVIAEEVKTFGHAVTFFPPEK
jgi:hypothetical protein